jgi:dienelactone hydrolase
MIRTILRPGCALVVLAIGTLPALSRAASIADFADYSLRNAAGNVVLPGRLFTPPEALADPATPRPFMTYLHGGGAIGTDNTTQILQTPDYMLDEAKRRGAYLYVPQAPSGWSSLASIDAAMTMINRAVTDLHANARRLYVAGYSNGGGGVWNIVSRNRGRFAAAFALAGVAPAAGFAVANLVDTPIFAVHARNDSTVPVGRSRQIVSGVLAASRHALPTYLAVSDPHVFIVANPQIPFHQQVLAVSTPDVATTFEIAQPQLDLFYYETPEGGHTDVLGIFSFPPLYEWMFSHALVPEPNGAALATVAWLAALLARGNLSARWRNVR